MSYDEIRKEGRYLDTIYGKSEPFGRLADELYLFRGKLVRVSLRICVFEIYPTTQEIWDRMKARKTENP